MKSVIISMLGAAEIFCCASSVAQATESNPLHLTFHHVTASVENLENEATWYERTFGFKRSALLGETDEFRMYQLTMPGYRIDLVHQKNSTRQHEAKGAYEQGWLHIVFRSPNLAGAYEYLKSRGTDVQAKKDGNTVVHLTLHDPEGNEIGIARD